MSREKESVNNAGNLIGEANTNTKQQTTNDKHRYIDCSTINNGTEKENQASKQHWDFTAE